MEMMNRAIEDAADFRKFMQDTGVPIKAFVNGASVNLMKQPGENRAQYRARLKREQRNRLVKA